jgi:sulfopyruvate decarboxylase TPP-binding subunit
MKKPNLAALQKQCDDFNARVPVGAAVTVLLDSGEVRATTTRSQAEVLSGHTPVVWLVGVRGCYLLDRVTPVPAAGGAS